jgi:hypothetical protein
MFALSREVVFVGYSLRDENIRRLIAEATAFHDRYSAEHRKLGTVISIDACEITDDGTLVELGIKPTESTPSVRRRPRTPDPAGLHRLASGERRGGLAARPAIRVPAPRRP